MFYDFNKNKNIILINITSIYCACAWLCNYCVFYFFMFVCESVRKGEGERESTRVKVRGEKNQLRERREKRER